ncbi:MAG: BON domain-containing protein [Acidobacteria bacterium]|nr:BON domain-containing protein [Acidobacteriota bacterium]
MHDVVPITRARVRRPTVPLAERRRTDAELDEAVRGALLRIAPLVGTVLRSEARDGVIVLTGAVDTDAGRLLVVEKAATVPGVRVVLCGIVLRCHPAAAHRVAAPGGLRLVR